MRPAPGEYVSIEGARRPTPPQGSRAARDLPPLSDPEELADRQKVLDALESCTWSQTRAADVLGISRRTLVSKLDRYGIPRPQKGRREDESKKTMVLTETPREAPKEKEQLES